jgi:hypothetical protein
VNEYCQFGHADTDECGECEGCRECGDCFCEDDDFYDDGEDDTMENGYA